MKNRISGMIWCVSGSLGSVDEGESGLRGVVLVICVR